MMTQGQALDAIGKVTAAYARVLMDDGTPNAPEAWRAFSEARGALVEALTGQPFPQVDRPEGDER